MPGQTAFSRNTRTTSGHVLLVLLISLVSVESIAVGCGVTPRGELSLAQCTDDAGIDDDGDHLSNCNDPDCWVYAKCAAQKAAHAGVDAAAIDTLDASNPSSGTDANLVTKNDAGEPVSKNDGGPGPATQCGVDGGPICGTDESCVLGTCVMAGPGDMGARYVLRIASAFVPDQTTELICFDTVSVTSGVCSVSPAFLCGNCKPDPYVITTINGDVVNKTSVASDTVAPSWTDKGFEIEVQPDDVLRFTVVDSDPALPKDTAIFYCDANIASLKTTGVIQCQPDSDSRTIPPPPGTKFTITVELSPAPMVE